MSKFKLSSELLIGESSEIDAVFLPVHLEQYGGHDLGVPSSPWAGMVDQQQQQHHHQQQQQQQQQPLLGSGVSGSKDGAGAAEEEEEESGSRALMNAIITNKPDSSDWCYRATLTTVGVIVLVMCFIVFGYSYIRAVLEWLEKVDTAVSLSVLVALFTFISFPVAWGLTLCMVACGYLYGLLYGPLAVTLGATVGLTVSMLLMRNLCSSYLRARFYSRKVDAIINVVSGSHGMKVIALTRLTPIPFGLQNALFSLSGISLLRYLISSVGGLVPMTILNCYLGSTLRNMHDLLSDDTNRLTGYCIFGGQLLVTALLLWFVVRKARVELKKAMDESDKSSTDLPNGDCQKTVFVDLDAS